MTQHSYGSNVSPELAPKQPDINYFGENMNNQLNRYDENLTRLFALANRLRPEPSVPMTDKKSIANEAGIIGGLNAQNEKFGELNRSFSEILSKLEGII